MRTTVCPEAHADLGASPSLTFVIIPSFCARHPVKVLTASSARTAPIAVPPITAVLAATRAIPTTRGVYQFFIPRFLLFPLGRRTGLACSGWETVRLTGSLNSRNRNLLFVCACRLPGLKKPPATGTSDRHQSGVPVQWGDPPILGLGWLRGKHPS